MLSRRNFFKGIAAATGVVVGNAALGNSYKTLEAIGNLPVPKRSKDIEERLAFKLLKDEESLGFEVTEEHYKRLLDITSLSYDIKKIKNEDHVNLWTTKTHNQLLISNLRMPNKDERDKDFWSFSSALTEGIIDCDLSALLYCSMNNPKKMEASMILMPNHAAVHIKRKRKKEHYIESTNGVLGSKEAYVNAFNIPVDSIERGQYLKPLTHDEARSAHLLQIATHLTENENLELAYKAISWAIKLDDKRASNFGVKGGILVESGYESEAVELGLKAIAMDPMNPSHYNRMAQIYGNIKGRMNDAINMCQLGFDKTGTHTSETYGIVSKIYSNANMHKEAQETKEMQKKLKKIELNRFIKYFPR